MTYQTPVSLMAAADPLTTPVGRANALLIRYPRFNQLVSHIQLCREMSQIAGEPQCLILEGQPGTGKSTLVQSYAATWARYETAHGTKLPIFYVETPSPATVKGLAARLLQALGDPAADHGTLWSMNTRLVHFIHTCEVQLIILDDFHHLIDTETNRVLNQVADWLKVLIKETQVPFLVVGVEGSVTRILEANAQLSRLFAIRETLRPFQWDSQHPETIQEFVTFVTFAERLIGVPLSAELPREELLYRVYTATAGVVGNVMNLLRYAVGLAQQQEAEVLSLATLTAAFNLRLAAHMHKPSPFVLAREPLVRPAAPPAAPPPADTPPVAAPPAEPAE